MTQIIASHRNKKYISNLVDAFQSLQTPIFADLYSLHGSQSHYKVVPYEAKIGTDFRALVEISNNVSSITEAHVHMLLDVMPLIGDLSAATKISLYFLSYPYISSDDRESLFGEKSHFGFSGELDEFAKAHINGSPSSDVRKTLHKFYMSSISSLQSPEDFVAKAGLCKKLDIEFHLGVSKLNYGVDDSDRKDQYRKILDLLDEPNVRALLHYRPSTFASYEALKKFGANSFGKVWVEDGKYTRADQRGNFLPEAFQKNDVDFFKSLSSEVFKRAEIDEVKKLVSHLSSSGQAMTESQVSMLNHLDSISTKLSVEQFQEGVVNRSWENSSRLVLELILSGDKYMLERHIKNLPDECASFLSTALLEVSQIVPRLSEDGMIGEPQKEAIIYLSEMVMKSISISHTRLHSINTENAYRVKEIESDRFVSVPLSELTPAQRMKWANATEEDRQESSKRNLRSQMASLSRNSLYPSR